jgi:hypothetical protein
VFIIEIHAGVRIVIACIIIPLLRGALRALKIILLTFTGIGRARMIQTTTEGLGPQHFLLGGLFAAILVNLVLGTLVWLAVR